MDARSKSPSNLPAYLNMASISIVMPCFNRRHEIPRVLRAYDEQDTHEDFELIAVDDGSLDGTADLLRSYTPRKYQLRVEELAKNRGPGAARNRGIELAKAPIVLFVGDDIKPESSFVRVHLLAHRLQPQIELAILGRVRWPADLPVNTLMQHIDGMGAQQFSYFYLEDGGLYDFRHFYTANVSIKRRLLESVDRWFDPQYAHAAFEDVELAHRLGKIGMKIVYNASAVGNHYHYHNIWTFSHRQYIAGKMSCVFHRQHPGALGKSPGRLRRYRPALDLVTRLMQWMNPTEPGIASWLEESALHLAAYYEWSPNSLLDSLYLKTLSYFWRKGVIEETIIDGRETQRATDLYARYALAPALRRFIETADYLRIDLPNGYGHRLTGRLRELEINAGMPIWAPLRAVRRSFIRIPQSDP